MVGGVAGIACSKLGSWYSYLQVGLATQILTRGDLGWGGQGSDGGDYRVIPDMFKD